MDSNEKLRLEIKQLSNLIAASTAERASVSHGSSQLPSRPIYHLNMRHYPSTSRQTFSSTLASINYARYKNPFDQFRSDSYINQVFPTTGLFSNSNTRHSNTTSNTTLKTDICNTVNSSKHTICCSSPYKFKKVNNDDSRIKASRPLVNDSDVDFNSAASSVNLNEVGVTKEEKPMSIFINPIHLAKVTSGESLVGLNFSNSVRPHINPAHSAFHLLTSNSSNNSQINSLIMPVSTGISYESDSVQNTQTKLVQGICENGTSGSNASENKELPAAAVTLNNDTLKSKYKLDRRVKRSPTRKLKIKIALNKRQDVPTTKLFKRYSMRVIPPSNFVTSNWQYQRNIKGRASVNIIHLNKKYVKQFVKPRLIMVSRSKTVVRKGRKSVVHIDGNKFITKNGGKTLKRMNDKVNVVSINGNRFIRKNGGKSLKRLSESLSSKISKPLNFHSQQQTPGVRLANRAILKSKITLSQRIWKKKQFCVFYNRFGECRRKDSGTCPYIHDPKQLMICPRFVVGKCANKNCKLSHDLKMGRMPPCQFFNKSECSRENCPYPHIRQSSPVLKKSSQTGKRNKTNTKEGKRSPVRKRKQSIRKERPQSPVHKAGNKNKGDPKSRYYEQSPDSQPIISIIPRRLPKESREEIPVERQSPTAANSAAQIIINVGPINNDPSGSTTSSNNDDRRMRLMSRISRLHERAKKKESTAPQFLPFN